MFCDLFFLQENTLHAILENDDSRGGWDWFCCSAYMTALLYSACWTATQVREQVVPRFCLVESTSIKLRLLVVVFAVSALFRQRDYQVCFCVF